eukprot:snap_masked-scaffold_10-processed-gene-11.36-mRNA-1 protein AED:0.01 eAED:0.02 QI:0/-1/0/1/-1/1/1/0/595
MAYRNLIKQHKQKPVLPVLDAVDFIEEPAQPTPLLPSRRVILGGRDLLTDPRFNKQSAFTKEERKRYQLRGLLPEACLDEELQMQRELVNLRSRSDDLEKYCYLMNLLERNRSLFYKVVVDNIQECMPLVYTPVVGRACQNYSHVFTKPKGVYVSIKDKGNVFSLLRNWPVDDVKAIVFTDGERILGLGDLGIDGMGIPVGKLQLYSACAGIAHHQCLPVCIDVGTNNQEKLKDELYMGLRQPRLRGAAYDELIVEFMHAAQLRWGRNILLQFEDFGNENAFRLLEMTKDSFTTFNDDIQGTAAVSLAGVLASARMTKKAGGPKSLKDHRVLFLGAGEAGTGIAQLIAYAKHMKESGLDLEKARENIWLCDSKGLVHGGRTGLAEHKEHFAHSLNEVGGDESRLYTFEEAVDLIKPTILIGVSGMPQTFTKPILEKMAEFNQLPLIFALSNPTSKAECTAEQAYTWTKGKCVFASGSPFDPVTIKGKTFYPGQGNNAYIFPGLALGVIASGACKVPEELLYVSATSLASQVRSSDFKKGSIYPPLADIREVSFKIAVDVAQKAYDMGIATSLPIPKDLPAFVGSKMMNNIYKSYT